MLAALVVPALALCSCDRPSAPEKPGASASVAWRACFVPRVSRRLQCAEVEVPERPDKPNGPKIRLRVTLAPAVRPDKQPDPLYFIAGGPGQAASRVAFQALTALAKVRRQRDLVFVDVRGTGDSAPLDCALTDDKDDLRDLFAATWRVDELRACAKRHSGRQLDTYRTETLVADLHRVARTLGHDRLNVYGISYGSRVALAWLRRHPEQVRAAILDGVAPPELVLFDTFAEDAQAAMDKLAKDCHADPRCGQQFGDPRAALGAAMQRLSAGPAEVTVTHPRTGEKRSLSVSADGIAMAVRGLLYSAELQALLPLALAEAATGDYAPLAAQALSLAAGAEESTSHGLLFEIACAEDVPRLRADEHATADGQTFLGRAIAKQARRACAAWTEGRNVTAVQPATPAPSDVPALLLSGALDPVTPPRWADVAAKQLTRSHHVVVPGAGHGTFATDCVPDLMADFLADGPTEGWQPDCKPTNKRPPFFLRRAGPAP